MQGNRLLLLLITILFLSNTYAQNIEKKNNLKFSTGYTIGALKNLEFAPVSRYDYNGLIYKLGYERLTKKENLFSIQFDYLTSSVLETERIPKLNLDYSKLGLNLVYLKSVDKKASDFSIHLGLYTRSDISFYSTNNYEISIANQSFGIGSKFSYLINERSTLYSNLKLPVVLFRLTNRIRNSTGDTYVINRYQSVLWNFGYKYSLSKYFDLNASYDFNYDRLQIPNAFREVQYQFNLCIQYKF